MQEMQQEGCDVFAAGQMSEADWQERFASIGVTYRQIRVSRNGLNPLDDIQTYFSIRRLLNEIRPDKIFVFQAKTIAYGCRAAASLGITEVYTLLAGVGSIYLDHGFRGKVIEMLLSFLYKKAFTRSKKVFFQNNDDKRIMIGKRLIDEDKIIMIPGSGVNIERFSPTKLPSIPTFLYIGRLIRDKGIGEYIRACKLIKDEYGKKVRCLLVGPFDSNPTSLKPKDLKPLVDQGIIEYFGEQTDVRPYIEECSIFMLPSYHEGTPKTILESMAMGRAIITSNAPGCVETVIDGVNGFLTEVRNVDDLVIKMKKLIENPELVKRMGNMSRKIACGSFDVRLVNDIILRSMCIRH